MSAFRITWRDMPVLVSSNTGAGRGADQLPALPRVHGSLPVGWRIFRGGFRVRFRGLAHEPRIAYALLKLYLPRLHERSITFLRDLD